jgi:4-hydroxybenzoate polyprenyltransferase
MRRIVRRSIAAIEVSRLSIAFGAVANVWLMTLLARADDRLAHAPVATAPLWEVLGAGALVAVGFLAFGAALNDFLDAKHDRAFAPERPLPTGALPARRAVQLAAVSLCIGVLGAVAFGTIAAVTAIALTALVLVYDAFAKHVPALGIVLAGLTTALCMLVPSVEATTLLPIWLAMSQTMGVGALAYIMGDKRPALTRRAVVSGAIGWAFWSAVLVWLELARNNGGLFEPWRASAALAIPAVTVAVGGALGAWKLGVWRLLSTRGGEGRRGAARGPRAGERVLRYGSLWKSLVAAAWLLAAGMPVAAAWIAGIAVAIFVLVALVREAGPQLAEPVGWRS